MSCCNKSVCSCRPQGDCVRICEPECTDIPCIPCAIEVEKTLIAVDRIPTDAYVTAITGGAPVPLFMPARAIELTYEITIENKKDIEITNLQIHDSLIALALENITPPYLTTIVVVKAPEYISVYSPEAIVANGGYISDQCYSILPCKSVSKILIKLVIRAPNDTNVDLRYVMNSVSVTGSICGKGRAKIQNVNSCVMHICDGPNILVGDITP